MAARGGGGVHRRRISTNTKMPCQQTKPRIGLATAKANRIGRESRIEQAVWIKLAIGGTILVHRFQLRIAHSHHSGADTKPPALRIPGFRANSRIPQCLLRSDQGKPMRI